MISQFVVAGLAPLLVSCGSSATDSSLTATSSAPNRAPGLDRDAKSILDSKIDSNRSGIDKASFAAAPAPGSCGNLGDNGKFSVESCSSSAYRVAQVVKTPNGCVSDVDQRAYFGQKSTDIFYTLCLDIAWSSGKCIDLAARAIVVPCGSPSRDRDKSAGVTWASTVIEGVDAKACNTRGAIVHDVRQFTVCIDS